MKRTIWLSLCLLMAVNAFAQTQQGYVKTKGRLGVNGSVIAGSRIQGATIQIKGRTSVLSQANGTFSFPVPAKSFYLQNVLKQGFVLTDPEVLSRQYSYSTDPLVLVMEDKAQQEAERREIERKISRKLYAELQKREDEIEALKEENKISEEKYQEFLQQLNKYQDDNASIIKEMAERYSKIDFDEVDDFNRRISDCIINGRLTEADSLLRTKGDISERFSKLNQHHDANVLARADLEKSEELEKRDREALAQDCYSWYELHKLKHQNDSAAYYLELRAEADTTNVEWQRMAGLFFLDYVSDSNRALSFYERALRNAKDSADYRHIYNDLGLLYYDTGHYLTSINYFKKALLFISESDIKNDKSVPQFYSNIASAYKVNNNLDDAFEYGWKAVELSREIFGENSANTGDCYNQIARLYVAVNEYEKALEYDLKVKEIYENIAGDHDYDLSACYNNLAGNYKELKMFDLANDYYLKGLELRKRVLGENNPRIATLYNNLGVFYLGLNRYQEAVQCYEKAVQLWSNSMLSKHHLIDAYGNLGVVYERLGDKEKALSMFEEGEKVVEELYQQGERDAMLFTSYIYTTLGELSSISDEYKQRYLHYMDDKAVVGIVPKGMLVPTAQRGMSGVYYILKFNDWDIESSTSFFDKEAEMNGKPKDILFLQDGQLRFEHFDNIVGCGWRLYYVTPEEKKQLRTVYEEWKK